MNDGYRPKGAPLSAVANPPSAPASVRLPEVDALRRELLEAIRLMPMDTVERQQWLVRAFKTARGE